MSAMEASSLANAGSFFSSSAWKRTFSSSTAWPGLTSAASFLASGPMTSLASFTSKPSFSERRLATGAREYFMLNSPLGRPRCEQRMTAAPCSSRYLIVGSAALMRVSSVMFLFSSRGTLKSQRTSTFLPETSMSSIVFLLKLMMIFLLMQ